MGVTRADYLSQLQALLPPGPAWPREPDALLTRLLDGFAEEFARVDARASQLADEVDPRLTFELLPDWERIAGLPSKCAATLTQTVSERRATLTAKITGTGGQSRQYFIDLAARLGFTITITEFKPYRVNSVVNAPVCSTLWSFVWQVNSALNTARSATVGMAVNDPLQKWGNQMLECVLGNEKPAHTAVLFVYQ